MKSSTTLLSMAAIAVLTATSSPDNSPSNNTDAEFSRLLYIWKDYCGGAVGYAVAIGSDDLETWGSKKYVPVVSSEFLENLVLSSISNREVTVAALLVMFENTSAEVFNNLLVICFTTSFNVKMLNGDAEVTIPLHWGEVPRRMSFKEFLRTALERRSQNASPRVVERQVLERIRKEYFERNPGSEICPKPIPLYPIDGH